MQEKIKRYIECNLEPEICNLGCEYCYLSQQNRKKQSYIEMKYSPQFVRKALSVKRLGGICFISLSVAGETLHSDFIIELTKELLKEGHVVNITTNGTLNRQFDKLFNETNLSYENLLVTFSLHYLEMVKLNLLCNFWRNVHMVKRKKASFCVKVNLYDAYLPYLDEICEMCLREVGGLPQFELTRKEKGIRDVIFSKYTKKLYYNMGKKYNSELFEFTTKNFRVNRRCHFCYAGDWAFVLNLRTGDMKGCYCDKRVQNIYDNIKKKISFAPIGNACEKYCHNGQHFLAWGVIPDLIDVPTYGELRNRVGADWMTDNMQKRLNTKLCESHREYSELRKIIYNLLYKKKSGFTTK